MADDEPVRDQIIAAYIARAAALIDEAREIMEEVAHLVLKTDGPIPTVFENLADTEQPCDSKEE